MYKPWTLFVVALGSCLAACSGADSAAAPPMAMPGADGAGPLATPGDASIAGPGAAPGPMGGPQAGNTLSDAGPTVYVEPVDPKKCGAVTEMAKNTRQPADIIFAIDTSGSMAEEVAFVQQNMNAFSRQIAESGVDAHVILIARAKDGLEFPLVETAGLCIDAPLGSGKCPEDSNPPNYLHIVQPVGDWDILATYIDNYPRYKDFLRPNSYKTFVSVSDDDLDNIAVLPPVSTPDTFIAAVRGLEPNSTMWSNWRYSGIYAFTQCLVAFGQGRVHEELVKRTGGVAGDLCLQDFAPVFNALAKQVTASAALACHWQIPPPPTGETFSATKTNVQLTLNGKLEQLLKAPGGNECGTREGWYYDDPAAPKRVLACPETCKRIQSAQEARVDLLFGCATVELL